MARNSSSSSLNSSRSRRNSRRRSRNSSRSSRNHRLAQRLTGSDLSNPWQMLSNKLDNIVGTSPMVQQLCQMDSRPLHFQYLNHMVHPGS